MTKEEFLERFKEHKLMFGAANREEQIEVLEFLQANGYKLHSIVKAFMRGTPDREIGFGIGASGFSNEIVTYGGGNGVEWALRHAPLKYEDYLSAIEADQISLNTEDFSLLWEDE